jgi:hypothetical protein
MVLDLLLTRQAGVISREQALGAGLGAATVDRLVRKRRWQPLHPRVYLAPEYECGDEARAWAAVLWAGDGAVLSGAGAAWWHGMVCAAPATFGVTAPVRRPVRPEVVVRCRMLDAADLTAYRGLPVTALALTALEAAAELGGSAGDALLDRALQDPVSWTDLLAAHRRNPATAGAALLAAATARATAEAGAILIRLLRRAGWRGWHQLPARSGRSATVVFPAARVAVEAMGWAPARAGAPPAGWRMLRVGRAELTARPAAVLAAIATAVEGRDLHHLGAGIRPSTGTWR